MEVEQSDLSKRSSDRSHVPGRDFPGRSPLLLPVSLDLRSLGQQSLLDLLDDMFVSS